MDCGRESRRRKFGGDSLPKALEMLGGVACLIYFSPLILLVFLLLKAGGGPAFVGHEHISSDGTSSTLWRFRAGNPEPSDKLGRFLLWNRAEVLPEIYNVAKGDIGFSQILSDI
jgi:lipopolysaccharide/colanic/teichoic acid biosynthesis glycosyltransferase